MHLETEGKNIEGKKAQFKGLENIILTDLNTLSPLCLCCWSLCATVIIVTRDYSCHRCILMRNCWAENNFLVMCCVCTSLDVQKGAYRFWSGNQKRSSFDQSGELLLWQRAINHISWGHLQRKSEWNFPSFLPSYLLQSFLLHLHSVSPFLDSVSPPACSTFHLPKSIQGQLVCFESVIF